jgi:hypothetical protein
MQGLLLTTLNVESKCDKTVINTTTLGVFIAGDGGYLATNTCLGRHGGHRQVVHTKEGKLIKYANTIRCRDLKHHNIHWFYS